MRAFVRDVLGHVVEDAPAGTRVDGASTSKDKAPCGFLDDGKDAEVKSSMMVWNRKCFKLDFQCVKQAKHDVLYLAWMTPRGVHVFLRDGEAGVCTTGKQTEATGKSIIFRSTEA